MVEVVEINNLDTLSSYHLDWTLLHQQTKGANFFNTLDWLRVYWKHYSTGKRLRVLVVQHNDRPIGILPLVEQTEVTHLGPMRVLTFPHDDWGGQYNLVGPNQTATLVIAMRHVAESERTWDIFEPRWFPGNKVDLGRIADAMSRAGLKPQLEEQRISSLVETVRFSDWEEYLESRTKKTRHELRRHLRRLDDEGSPYRFVRYRPDRISEGGGDPRWELYEDCFKVAQASWQSEIKRDGNTICHEGVSEFLMDAHEVAARTGMLDVCLLYHHEKPVAFLYGYYFGGEVICLRRGHDQSHREGVGTILMAAVIRDSISRGDFVLDLGSGEEAYKRRLRTGEREVQKATHIAPLSFRTKALKVMRQIRHTFVGNPSLDA